MQIFYFTSTGNSLSVAKEFDAELLSVPKMLKENRLTFEADKIGFIMPLYYLGTPRIMEEFIAKATFKADYIFAIMTYGNATGSGIGHFDKLANQQNIKLSYTNEILMVDNYLPMFDVDEQIKKTSNKDIDEKIKQVVSDVNASKAYKLKKSGIDKTVTFLSQAFYKSRIGNCDKKFYVEDSCTSCKICEKVCPVDNIKVDEKPQFNHNCEECLGCINLCPVKAIKLKKEKGTGRYRNSNVSVQEIIESNN